MNLKYRYYIILMNNQNKITYILILEYKLTEFMNETLPSILT